MLKNLILIALVFSLVACSSTSSVVKRDDPVAIVLKNGDEIDAKIMDIWQDKVVFQAEDWKKAYEYGEVINVERIMGIRIADGTVLSVKDYDAFRRGKKNIAKKVKPLEEERVAEARQFKPLIDGESQYERLKKKPIAEMTDREFEYFMMMKKRELKSQSDSSSYQQEVSQEESTVSAEEPSTPRAPTPTSVEPPVPSPDDRIFFETNQDKEIQLDAVADSFIEAGLAPSYLTFLNQKRSRGESLTATESTLLRLIEDNPKWQEKIEEIRFIDRKSRKTLERAYLFSPDELSGKLGLEFDKDLDMDYLALMKQLHRKIGEDVKMGDFRVMVEILGEGGARAVKEILENYQTWQFVRNSNQSLVVK
ncbi:hypothetical protein GWO43_05160 [candidate division KSB1 bacterium]|nr:hypothetical protein [candidate division KSB1 bacterium]NIR71473.1 hypothetical protein [candidate division KSB1 bacterium]NIS23394.1 hypothetical protein [candidate division KSB1 bacterium]NIT70285.1 hypothetical protein [candidate division KSB1 bacterium]NIU24008.1 hypothetical protein [candidate division KSB1 bacterium]